MKLGTKSNLISAYAALFTVAAGILLFDAYQTRPATSGAVATAAPEVQAEARETDSVASGQIAALR